MDAVSQDLDLLYWMIRNEALQLKKKGYDKDAADEIMVLKFKSKTGIFKEYYDLKNLIMGGIKTEEDEEQAMDTEFELFCYLMYRYREFGDVTPKYGIN